MDAYSQPAVEYANLVDSRVILIDGVRLADLMIDFNVGTSPVAIYEVKRVDLDFFEEP